MSVERRIVLLAEFALDEFLEPVGLTFVLIDILEGDFTPMRDLVHSATRSVAARVVVERLLAGAVPPPLIVAERALVVRFGGSSRRTDR